MPKTIGKRAPLRPTAQMRFSVGAKFPLFYNAVPSMSTTRVLHLCRTRVTFFDFFLYFLRKNSTHGRIEILGKIRRVYAADPNQSLIRFPAPSIWTTSVHNSSCSPLSIVNKILAHQYRVSPFVGASTVNVSYTAKLPV